MEVVFYPNAYWKVVELCFREYDKEKKIGQKYGKFSENTGSLIYQDLCPLTLFYIIYNNAI